MIRVFKIAFLLVVAGFVSGAFIGGILWFVSADFLHGRHMSFPAAALIGFVIGVTLFGASMIHGRHSA